MSQFWLLGLGASLGYMMMKKSTIEGELRSASRQVEGKTSAEFSELKRAERAPCNTDEIYHKTLPKADRAALEAGARAMEQREQQYDAPVVPTIHGIYLDGYSS